MTLKDSTDNHASSTEQVRLPKGAQGILREIVGQRIIQLLLAECLASKDPPPPQAQWLEPTRQILGEFPILCQWPTHVYWKHMDDDDNRWANSGESLLSLVCRLRPPLELVQQIYQAFPAAISQSTYTNALPLQVACAHAASEKVIQFLIACYPEAVAQLDGHGCSCFSTLIHCTPPRLLSPRLVEWWIQTYPPCRTVHGSDEWTLLHAAAYRGHGPTILQLLKEGILSSSDISEGRILRRRTRQHGLLPLHLACMREATEFGNDNDDAILWLHQQAPDTLHTPDWNVARQTPLECAVLQQSLPVIRSLLHPAPVASSVLSPTLALPPVNVRSGATLLHVAAQCKNPRGDVLEYLAQTYPVMLRTRMNGLFGTGGGCYFPLHWACETAAPLEHVRILIRHYPLALFLPDGRLRTPLDIVQSKHGGQELCQLLQQSMKEHRHLDISTNPDSLAREHVKLRLFRQGHDPDSLELVFEQHL